MSNNQQNQAPPKQRKVSTTKVGKENNGVIKGKALQVKKGKKKVTKKPTEVEVSFNFPEGGWVCG